MNRLALLLGFLVSPVLLLAGCESKTELVWNEEPGYRWADLGDLNGSRAGFEAVEASRSGVTFVNTLREESLLRNRHYMNGSGVAVGDVDGDGWTDIYFARLDGPNVLYRNLGGWRFEDITHAAGVAAPDRFATGAVFADIDGDDDLDLLLTSMGGPNSVFLNDGTGTFAESTDASGLASGEGSTTLALADIDGDGDLDLYVSNYKSRAANDLFPPEERTFERTVVRQGGRYGIAEDFQEHYELIEHAGGLMRVERAEPNRLYLNDGNGRFRSVANSDSIFVDETGNSLQEVPEDWTLVARFQDVNGDGTPDLYVCNDFESPDYFWIGDGDGHFRQIALQAVRHTSFSTMSVDFSDIDRDGDLDFFLTDMLSRDYERRQMQVGSTIPMTTEIGQTSNRPQIVQNTLQLNRGDGTYAEIARLGGVAASDWTWSGLFMDVDLDGFEDLLLTTGHLYDVTDKDAQMQEMQSGGKSNDPDAYRRALLDYPPLPLKNVAFRNNGDLSFEAVKDGWGIGTRKDVSNALAFGDFDNDGDLDVVVNRLNETAGLFRNVTDAARLAVRLRGEAPNTQGIGARIVVHVDGLPVQEKEVVSGGIYLSGSDPVYSFAAGHSDGVARIEVFWRDGTHTQIDSVRANRIVEIFHHQSPETTSSPSDIKQPNGRGSATAEPPNERIDFTSGRSVDPDPGGPRPLFEHGDDRLDHVHTDTPYAEFEHQPLLRRGRTRLGPGAAWADVDGDDDDDLFIGAGRGGAVALYRNDAGRFSVVNADVLGSTRGGDLTGLVYLPTARGGQLFAGESHYEDPASDSSWIHIVTLDQSGATTAHERIPFGRASIGPLSLVDVDNDGDLDLFAGGQQVGGDPIDSRAARLYINDGGSFRYDVDASAPFDDIAGISAAAFGDMDRDGDQDAVLATSWGPVRYFENDGGRFTDRTTDVGLDAFSGWWNGVSLGDFDSDGRLDVVATNWGWNGEHQRLHRAQHPIRIYHGDFDADGIPEALEAIYEPDRGEYVPIHDLTVLSEALPYIRQRLPSYSELARSTLAEVIGFRLDRASILEANTLTSMLFLNRIGGANPEGAPKARNGRTAFESVQLPLHAQFSAAFAPVVGDFNGDGNDDLFLSQNYFDLSMQLPRQDAGRGLLLLGDGRAGFKVASAQQTGIAVYGEQRAAAPADIDRDGRLDLAVTQHGGRTMLYRNEGAPHGLLVRIQGRSTNPTAVGATVRLEYADGSRGPVRLISAGSGYWSQDSAVQVLAPSPQKEVRAIIVSTPRGSRIVHPVPDGASRITISLD